MARVKPKKEFPQLKSWDEVDLALAELAELERGKESIEAVMQETIAAAKLQAKTDAEPVLERMELLAHQIEGYAGAHRTDLGTGKTKVLVFGQVGWRKSTKVVVPRDADKLADIIRQLRERGWDDCVTVTQPKINKDALRAHPLEDIAKLGVSVQVDDNFWIETKRDDIPQEV